MFRRVAPPSDRLDDVDELVTTKAELRRAILRDRRETPTEHRQSDDDALRAALCAAVRPGEVVCAYVPVGFEPGSISMLDSLVTGGVRVLLPVAREVDGQPSPLRWGTYRGGAGLIQAPFGLREPGPPIEPAEAISTATLVAVPALAVDLDGVRLGRGAGFYDRSLPLADPAARLVAVVRDEEVVDRLPGEPHDVSMTHALTPRRGLFRLGRDLARPGTDS